MKTCKQATVLLSVQAHSLRLCALTFVQELLAFSFHYANNYFLTKL